jgi:hypothetical protein
MAMVNHFSSQLNQIDKVVNRNHIHIGWVPITTFLYPQTKHTLILLSRRIEDTSNAQKEKNRREWTPSETPTDKKTAGTLLRPQPSPSLIIQNSNTASL